MSYGGCDFGPRRNSQFTPHDYRSIGEATANAIADLLLSKASLAAKEVMLLLPPPPPPKDSHSSNSSPNVNPITIKGEVKESRPKFFQFKADDLSLSKPKQMNLVLNQVVRDNNTL